MFGNAVSPRTGIRLLALLQYLAFVGRATSLPFINLYLVASGFSGTQIGILAAISAVVRLIASPLLHALADHTGRHRRVLNVFSAGNMLTSFGLTIGNSTPWLGGMVLLHDLSDLSSASLLSQLTITWLDRHKRPIYGRLRAWGSVGWASASLLSGRIFALGGYHLIFFISGVVNLVFLLFTPVLPERTNEHPETSGTAAPRTIGFYWLMVSLFLLYAGFNGVATFLYVFVEHDLGATKDQLALVMTVSAVVEIPIMLWVDNLLRRFDIRMALVLGNIGMGITWMLFSVMTQWVPLLFVLGLRGVFFTFHLISMTVLIARISHPSNVATNQAIAQVTLPSLAALVFGPINGWLFDQVGPRTLFQFSMCLALLSGLCLLLARRTLAQEKMPSIPEPPYETGNVQKSGTST